MNQRLFSPYLGSSGPRNGSGFHPDREGNDGGRPRRPHDALIGAGPFAESRSEPDPVPWRAAANFLVTAVGLKHAALRAPEVLANQELVRWADGGVAEFIDDWCGTKPHVGPGRWPWPGPNPSTPELVTQLGLVANSLHAGGMREELEQIAGRIVTQSYASTAAARRPVPTAEELDALAQFTASNTECDALCRRLRVLSDELSGASPQEVPGIAATMRAINVRMKQLHCSLCEPG